MESQWTSYRKIGFLFLAYYSLLYVSGSQFFIAVLTEPLWRMIVPEFASIVGHTEPVLINATGSGDTSYKYFAMLFFFVLAVTLAIITFLLDRGRKNYQVIYNWFTLLLRYFLASQLISYGLAKVFCLQFGDSTWLPLETNFGDISPMRLLWSFMAFSKGYTIFSGLLELAAGLFLLTRKTTLLGSLLGVGVMANVMMLNYCYDVPVKLLSSHMVFFLAFLVLIHIRSLISFFVLGRKTDPYVLESVVSTKYARIVNIIKWLIILFYLASTTNSFSKSVSKRKMQADHIRLKEVNYVREFAVFREGREVETLEKYEIWKSIDLQYSRAIIIFDDESKESFSHEIDSEKRLLLLKSDADTSFQKLTYSLARNEDIHLNGSFYGDSLSMKMSKKGYPLLTRGFHWISEYPYNK